MPLGPYGGLGSVGWTKLFRGAEVGHLRCMARAWWHAHLDSPPQCPAPPHLRGLASEYPSNMHAALWGREWCVRMLGRISATSNRLAHTRSEPSYTQGIPNSVLARPKGPVSAVCTRGGRRHRGGQSGGIRSPPFARHVARGSNGHLQRPSGAGGVSPSPSVEVEIKV
jgi:hypothetical protein